MESQSEEEERSRGRGETKGGLPAIRFIEKIHHFPRQKTEAAAAASRAATAVAADDAAAAYSLSFSFCANGRLKVALLFLKFHGGRHHGFLQALVVRLRRGCSYVCELT